MSSLSATQPASVPHSMPVAIAPTPLSFLVVILDPSVKDLSMLMAHVVPEATVFLLEGDRDGIQQITEILQLHPHLTQVHLISHGSPGCLYLGNTELSLATLDRYTPQLQTWFTASPPRSIAPPSHILLYGCQVAAGDAGAEFIDGLKRLTGADITASQTLTGSAALGGDWNLDKTTCDTPVTLAFHAEGLKDYPFVLPVFNNLYYGLFSIDGGSTFRELRTVNLSTGASTAVTGTSSTLFDSAAMSRDAIAGRIYYIERVSSNARVAYYDTLTGTHTLVGTTGAANTFIRMATAADGTIWASGTNNELYSINPGTGQATLRYTMGFTAAVASGDMAFDPNNANVLYVTRGATTIELYRIVLNTANYSSSTTTLVGDTGQSGSGSGAMAFGNDGKLYSSSNSNLIEINTITAAASIVATAIGSVGDFTSLPIPQANPANAPTPTTDSYTITTNSSINLLAAPNSIFANDSDPNGDPLTLLSVTQASNGTVTLNNNQTPFNSNDDTLIYTPNANFSGIDSFTYTVGDGKGGYNVSTVNIKVNAPPVLDLDQNNSTTAGNNYQATFTEGGSAVSIADSDIVITDANDTNLESATIVLTNAQIDDVLAIGTLPAGINSTIDTSVAGQITITLTGSASKTDYGTAIRAITFSNTSSNPITTNRTLNITVNDGDITSNITTTTMAVQAVNAPPVVDLNGSNDVGNNYSTTFTEGGSPVAIADTDLLISDADGTDINTLTLSVSSIPDAANEVLNIGGQTIVLTNGTGVTTVGGTSLAIAANNGAVSITRQGGGDIPSADLQTLLQGITYQNNSTTPTTINRIITVKANDGTADSNLATSTITIDANQSPVIDLNGSSTSLDEVVNNLLVPTGDALAAPPKSAWEVLLYAGHFGVAGAPNQGTGNDQLSQNGFGLDGGTPQLHAQSFIGQGLNSYTFTTRLGGTTSFSSSTDPVTRAATASGITFINNSANGAYAPSTYGNSGIWSYVLRRDVTEPTTITIGEAGDWFDDYGELFVNGVRINPAILSFTSNLPASSILQATVQPGDRVEVRLTNIGGPGGFHVEFSSPGLIPDANFANSFTEGSAPIRLVDTDGDVSDTGENDITQLNITPNQLLDGAFETLVLTDSNSTVQTIALSTPLSAPLTAVFGGTTFSIGYNGAHLTITNQSGATTPMAQADLDALIRSLTYQNTSENPTAGNRTFTFSLTDSANQSSNPAIATITVTPVNDPPLIDLNGSNDAGNDYSGTFTENGAPVKIVDTDAIATDVDGTDIETLTLTFNAIPDGTNEVLTIGGQAILLTNGTGTTTVGGTTFAIAANNGTVTLTRQGGGNIANADIQTLLQSVTYQNNSDSPTGSSRIITIKANDGIAESNLASSTITIQPTNDPPAVDLNGNGAGTNFTVSFLENTAATPITDPTATLFDLDGTDINTVTLNISGLLDGASEILQIGGQAIPLVNGSSGTATVGGTVFAIAGTNSTVTLTKQGGGDIPNADIQTLLRGITYQNNSEDPSGGDRIITVLANDGNIDSNLATSTITVTAINDAPVLDLDANDSSGATTSDYTNRFTRGTPVTIGDTDTLITDADDTLIESATIQLTTKPNGASESLNLTGAAQAAAIAAGITVGVYNPTTGQLQLTGAASLAAYEMAIAAITYNNTAANPDRSDRIITAIVQDGTSNSNLATVTLRYDTDGDGVVDAIDLDDDNDGVTDTDEMQSNPLRDTDGDGIIDSLDLDSDNDGITDLMESGLSFAEIATLDTNQDGMIDPTYIVGTNGLADVVEVSPDSNSVDYNNDGISDAPVDTDGDGKRDFQDLDADNDGINDVVEAGGADTDGNGLIDGTGTDTNGNGLANSVDPGNGGTPLPIPDTDADGKANFRDLDSDNDGLPDWSEAGLPVTVDQNGDGVVDGTDTDGDGILDRVDGLINGYGDNNGPASNALPNDDGDATPNYLDLDSDGDGTPDRIEAGLPT
nr:DUF4347 domain-containing protein [Oculatellaceae cyanobacterium Prado106]